MSKERHDLIPQDATAWEIIKSINTWAKTAGYPHNKDLWNVLTALRGPDATEMRIEVWSSDNAKLKRLTTGIVRRDTVPNLARAASAVVADSGDHLVFVNPNGGRHFENHIHYALRVIHENTKPRSTS